MYNISRPLVGTPGSMLPPTVAPPVPHLIGAINSRGGNGPSDGMHKTILKPVHSFTDLLNEFPLLARELQPSLEKILHNVEASAATWTSSPLPHSPTTRARRSSSASRSSISSGRTRHSLQSGLSDGTARRTLPSLAPNLDEGIMKSTAEKAVTASIDALHQVSQSQLNLLASQTGLAAFDLERLLEKFVMEQLHQYPFYPRLCQMWTQHDRHLEARMMQLGDIDIGQIGIVMVGGLKEKVRLAERIEAGCEEFEKMGVASSPLETMHVLQETLRRLSVESRTMKEGKVKSGMMAEESQTDEKPGAILTVDADLLVSLLLMVVARSEVRHLYARLSYMQHFIFIDDPQSGEMGYALSTLEAVMAYIDQESASLCRMSRLNRRLRHAVQAGDKPSVQLLLSNKAELTLPSAAAPIEDESIPARGRLPIDDGPSHPSSQPHYSSRSRSRTLQHVYPFERPSTNLEALKALPPLPKAKKVTLDTRSISMSSISGTSQSGNADFSDRVNEPELSLADLAHIRDSRRNSVLMLAIEAGQKEMLQLLLDMTQFFPSSFVVEDLNASGTTLLSAAVQTGDTKILEILLRHEFFRSLSSELFDLYLATPDSSGRTVGHFLFNSSEAMLVLGRMIDWQQRDRNGQTPLFAACRCYDHPAYEHMVMTAISYAEHSRRQLLGSSRAPLRLSVHVDRKGNTLLHILRNENLIKYVLMNTICDPNLVNDRQFTPLMVLSKYEKIDAIVALLHDPRVDVYPREARGLTAVELAKTESARDAMDDQLFMFLYPFPGPAVGVIRAMLVEDATIRIVLKSRSTFPEGFRITTTKRGLDDFFALARRLLAESPASWLPSINDLLTPFNLPSKPSRAVLRDIQFRLDSFFKTLLSHPTFSRNPLVWEFILAPELDTKTLDARTDIIARSTTERIKEEYAPLADVRDTDAFIAHTRDAVATLDRATRTVREAVLRLRIAETDLTESVHLLAKALQPIPFVPHTHQASLAQYANIAAPSSVSPLTKFNYALTSQISITTAILTALNRPQALSRHLGALSRSLNRHTQALKRSNRWPMGLLDDTREKVHREAEERYEVARAEVDDLGREIRWNREVVAQEVSGWQDGRAGEGRRVLVVFAREVLMRERERLMRLENLVERLRGVGR